MICRGPSFASQFLEALSVPSGSANLWASSKGHSEKTPKFTSLLKHDSHFYSAEMK